MTVILAKPEPELAAPGNGATWRPSTRTRVAPGSKPRSASEAWRTYRDYLRTARQMASDVARGLPKYAARIPGASAMNALDLAPLPQSLVQRMLSYGQGPQT